MEIKVGEYVRTKDGFIFKMLTKEECSYGYYGMTDSSEKYSTYTYGKGSRNDIKNKIENHSFNIKDLIEKGDIVNESLIVYKGKVASGKEKLLIGNYIINGMPLEVANIKTILTKEQYERNCYRLENNEC